ncbi:MAG: divalent-cation tolerance protein CutA [Candidatus Omnitrophota bacterium]
MTNACVVFVTAPKGRQPQRLAKILLEKKLCACVNILPSLESWFWWEGKIDKAAESLLIIKTKKTLLPRLIRTVKKAHSYDVCEVIALPIIAGAKDYLEWINASCVKEGR